jgi:hypothetical protein
MNVSNSPNNELFRPKLATYLTTDLLNKTLYTADQLRFIVNNDAYCYKVISYFCERMGNVDFDVKLNYIKRSRNVNDKVTWINNSLKSIIPWFVETQKTANIVGKAYLVFNVKSINPIPENQFPISQEIIWDNNVEGLIGLKVFGCDELNRTDDDKYFIKRYSNSDGIRSLNNLTETDVTDWVKRKRTLSQDKIKDNQYSVIHSSHVLEFTAFDYQDDRETLLLHNKRRTISEAAIRNDNNDYLGISFRLIRFLDAMNNYKQFIKYTLKRMNHSEATLYKKENLGEINQAIAKHIASSNENQLQANITEVIKQELVTIRDSLSEFGVALIDKKNDIVTISRNLSGVSDIADIFYRDIIAASYLTEYALFGTTSGGSGLAGVDERDRAQLGQATDELFANYWKPILQLLSNFLAQATGQIYDDKHVLSIDQKPSYKMSPTDASDWLSSRIKILIDLYKEGLIDKQVVLNEITSNGMLGSHFSINESDISRLLE